MGTSTNQKSPNTPSWHAAQAAYRDATISIERVVQEVWKAATHQKEGDLARDLASSAIGHCLQIAATAESRDAALREATAYIALSGEASLATDIAQRALIHAFRETDRPERAFAANLFAEASDYLVSRDLPGYVGEQGRMRNASESLEFKSEIRSRVASHVLHLRPAEPSQWAAYVAQVVDHLRGSPRQES